MVKLTSQVRLLLAATLCSAIVYAPTVSAQGKIVCWKDKSGKTVGCGDTVPPEYQTSATKELDRRGVTRATTDSVEDAAKRSVQNEEKSRQKSEEERKIAEQRRQDMALINTYTSEKEIDGKRDRDLQVVDLQISQLNVTLQNAADREKEVKTRAAAMERDKKPVPQNMKDEVARITGEREKIEQSIANKEKEKADIRKRYAEYKKRYAELRGTAPQTTAGTKK